MVLIAIFKLLIDSCLLDYLKSYFESKSRLPINKSFKDAQLLTHTRDEIV